MMRLLILLLALLSAPACADEFKPAYLQLTELGSGVYDVLWKVPALDESTTLKVRPVLPSGTAFGARSASKRDGQGKV